MSRFGRDLSESGKYIENVFPFLGVRFISVNDAIDSLNKNGRGDDILIPVLNLINDAYSKDISIKIRSQLDVKRRKGDFIGAFAVYGYMRDERNHNKIVIDETAADIVKLIFKWKLDGHSAQAIAEKLNTLGTPSPMEYKKSIGLKYSTSFAKPGKTIWSAVAVSRILRDETYIGTMVQGKCATPNHKDGMGRCTAHYIREEVLRNVVLEHIQRALKYIQQFESSFVRIKYEQSFEDRRKEIAEMKREIIKANRRIAELTPTVLNEFISRIEVHAPEKNDGKRTQQIDIFYNAVGIINIPTPEELAAMQAERKAQQQKEHISA